MLTLRKSSRFGMSMNHISFKQAAPGPVQGTPFWPPMTIPAAVTSAGLFHSVNTGPPLSPVPTET